MPSRVNGFGTWYYGRKNVVQYQGVCRSCKRASVLTSYDTRLWVSLLFIPTVPLRRYRIIEQCGSCTRHMVMPYEEWERAQVRAQEAVTAYKRSPGNPQQARDALELCVGQRNLPAFLELAPLIEKNLSRDAKSLRLVAAVYEMFYRLPDAERVLRAVLNAQDDAETREALANSLLLQGRPAEAEPLLQHVIDQSIPDRVELLFQLAQGYQLKGEHEKALKVFDQCETVNPLIARDDTFTRLRAASEQSRGSRKAVNPNQIMRKARRAQSGRKLAKVLPVGLALVAAAYFALAWIEGGREPVYLANGLQRSYKVSVNGVAYTLPAQSVIKARVPEGDIRVVIEGTPPEAAQTVSIHTPLLTRPFSGATFVINPDQTAIIERQRVSYARQGYPTPAPQSTFAAGRGFYRYDGIDYPFEQPPHSMQVDESSNSVTTKEVLSIVGREANLSPGVVLYSLADQIGKQNAVRGLEEHLRLEPDKSEYIAVLRQMTTPQERADFIRPLLQQRPIQVHWHRLYQDAMSEMGKSDQVQQEYEAMLASAPNDNVLAYLAGRATRSSEKFLAYYKQATTGDAPCPWAFSALCGYYQAVGQPHEAAVDGLRALELSPDEQEFRYITEKALIGDGQYAKAIELLNLDAGGEFPICMSAMMDQIYVYTVQNKPQDAQTACLELQGKLHAVNPAMVDAQLQRANASIDYCQGNIPQFLDLLLKSTDSDDRFAAHLTADDMPSAEQDLKTPQKPEPMGHLLLYIAATKNGRTDMAAQHLKAAIDLLAAGDQEERLFASALSKTASVPVAEILQAREPYTDKLILVTALGLADPASKDQCFTLARKLDWDRRFPHRLIQSVLQ